MTNDAGCVRVHADYDRDFTIDVDVVVVGSGPGGAVAAKELTDAGLRVALLEEGPPFTPQEYELDGAISMARTMREGGLRMTKGTVMPTMQGIALGGGSLVNSAICNRAPDFVLDDWSAKFDLERTTRADLDPHYDAVGEFLGICPTPDDVRTDCTPVAPFKADSIGNVTSVSTSSGARPCDSVMITTRGRFKSGNTSIGNSVIRQLPKIRRKIATTAIKMRCCKAKRIIFARLFHRRTILEWRQQAFTAD